MNGYVGNAGNMVASDGTVVEGFQQVRVHEVARCDAREWRGERLRGIRWQAGRRQICDDCVLHDDRGVDVFCRRMNLRRRQIRTGRDSPNRQQPAIRNRAWMVRMERQARKPGWPEQEQMILRSQAIRQLAKERAPSLEAIRHPCARPHRELWSSIRRGEICWRQSDTTAGTAGNPSRFQNDGRVQTQPWRRRFSHRAV